MKITVSTKGSLDYDKLLKKMTKMQNKDVALQVEIDKNNVVISSEKTPQAKHGQRTVTFSDNMQSDAVTFFNSICEGQQIRKITGDRVTVAEGIAILKQAIHVKDEFEKQKNFLKKGLSLASATKPEHSKFEKLVQEEDNLVALKLLFAEMNCDESTFDQKCRYDLEERIKNLSQALNVETQRRYEEKLKRKKEEAEATFNALKHWTDKNVGNVELLPHQPFWRYAKTDVCNIPKSTAVVLPNSGEQKVLNANFVQLTNETSRVIATQSPREPAQANFWLAAFHHDSPAVVDLTQEQEIPKRASRYYPTRVGESKTFISSESGEQIEVTLSETKKLADNIHQHSYAVTCNGVTKNINRLHYTGWVYHNKVLPDELYGLVETVNGVVGNQNDKPIVVHCSAGIGRTGTFTTARALLARYSNKQSTLQERKDALLAMVKQGRLQRSAQFVQKPEQYHLLQEFVEKYTQNYPVVQKAPAQAAAQEPTYTNQEQLLKNINVDNFPYDDFLGNNVANQEIRKVGLKIAVENLDKNLKDSLNAVEKYGLEQNKLIVASSGKKEKTDSLRSLITGLSTFIPQETPTDSEARTLFMEICKKLYNVNISGTPFFLYGSNDVYGQLSEDDALKKQACKQLIDHLVLMNQVLARSFEALSRGDSNELQTIINELNSTTDSSTAKLKKSPPLSPRKPIKITKDEFWSQYDRFTSEDLGLTDAEQHSNIINALNKLEKSDLDDVIEELGDFFINKQQGEKYKEQIRRNLKK